MFWNKKNGNVKYLNQLVIFALIGILAISAVNDVEVNADNGFKTVKCNIEAKNYKQTDVGIFFEQLCLIESKAGFKLVNYSTSLTGNYLSGTTPELLNKGLQSEVRYNTQKNKIYKTSYNVFSQDLMNYPCRMCIIAKIPETKTDVVFQQSLPTAAVVDKFLKNYSADKKTKKFIGGIFQYKK
jgi:hypothetical protein